jgi:hypothetical protein
LVEMAIFIALVFVAYAYIWRKGGLDWASEELPPTAEPVATVEEPEREAVGAR